MEPVVTPDPARMVTVVCISLMVSSGFIYYFIVVVSFLVLLVNKFLSVHDVQALLSLLDALALQVVHLAAGLVV